MDSAPTTAPMPLALARRIDWGAVSAWALGLGLILLLGLNGGGYDPLVHDQVGIGIWWIALAGLLAGALPLSRQRPPAWTALGLFAAFAVWTALSLTWTESVERSWADLVRLLGYLGVFALALFIRGSKNARHLIAAVGTGIAVVTIVGLLSRLHPAWFPEADQTAQFLGGEVNRLAYPLNYWNALAALVAIGIPPLLWIATCAKHVLTRALAAGALPVLALTVFFTLSRGGAAAALVAIVAFLALSSDRLPKLLTTLVAGAGSAILIAAAAQRDALADGLLGPIARNQGDEMLAMACVVCAGVAFLQAAISLPLLDNMRPRWTYSSRRTSALVAIPCVVAVLIALAAIDAPGKASDAWSDFKASEAPGKGVERLQSVSGNGRYQLWASGGREYQAEPLLGTGAATYEYWWARDGDAGLFVRDTHSLYLQTLGELGIVGLALLATFLVLVLGLGVRRLLRASTKERPLRAAALAGCLSLLVAGMADWYWQVPVLPAAFLLLASTLVASGGRDKPRSAMQLPARIGLTAVCLAAIAAIAIPLASTALVRESQAEAQSSPAAALAAARDAERVQPGAATPRLQQALLLEQQGRPSAAQAAGHEAADREPTNWRTWMTLSRIEALHGNAAASVRHYRRARFLNPMSAVFR